MIMLNRKFIILSIDIYSRLLLIELWSGAWAEKKLFLTSVIVKRALEFVRTRVDYFWKTCSDSEISRKIF